MRGKLILLTTLSLLFLPVRLFAERADDPVLMVLSSQHMKMDIDKLEQLVGGEEVLVKRLLVLRHQGGVPFVSVRAEKLLLHYSSREDVKAALEEDLQSPETKGLARVIAIHLDRVADSALKEGLARKLINLASADKDFLPYARAATIESTDPKLRELGRDALK